MRTALHNILLLLVVLTTLACNDDKTNIVVTGQIIDEITGKPIPNAEVLVHCWYHHTIDDNNLDEETLTTDDYGCYKIKFSKGHRIDVASIAKDYQPSRSHNKLKNNVIEVNLKLRRIKENPTLNSNVLYYDPSYLKVRIPAVKNGESMDFGNAQTFGFDFKSLKTNSDTTQTDLWYKIDNKEGLPSTIVTSHKGGLIPIFSNELKSSFVYDLLYEKTTAPVIGYVSLYKLTGKEKGFFIRCRNGNYGKMIFGGEELSVSVPDGQGGYYKEFGKDIICLYQSNGTTDLTYPQTDIDLKSFLRGFF
ncbi:hypothetical protein [Aquimarina algiphila]|uniref:hypothetical protein n=1 Tax=Aquimarina algiphila TaxID=2047982 RepID=UPI002491C7A3|nr:hypothetical protein [Aquimarina algiphila]